MYLSGFVRKIPHTQGQERINKVQTGGIKAHFKLKFFLEVGIDMTWHLMAFCH